MTLWYSLFWVRSVIQSVESLLIGGVSLEYDNYISTDYPRLWRAWPRSLVTSLNVTKTQGDEAQAGPWRLAVSQVMWSNWILRTMTRKCSKLVVGFLKLDMPNLIRIVSFSFKFCLYFVIKQYYHSAKDMPLNNEKIPSNTLLSFWHLKIQFEIFFSLMTTGHVFLVWSQQTGCEELREM